MSVPFVSQLEAYDTKGWNNCLGASVWMLLGYNGAVSVNDGGAYHDACDFIRDGVYDGDYWENSYTDYPWAQILLAETYGLPTAILHDWPAVFAYLKLGQPVIVLLKNRPLQPRQYPQGPGWDASHFIVLDGYSDTHFAVCDPLDFDGAREPGHYTRESVEAGVSQVGGVYALVIDQMPPGHEEDDMACQEQLTAISVDNERLNWLRAESERFVNETKYRAEVSRKAKKLKISQWEYVQLRAAGTAPI